MSEDKVVQEGKIFAVIGYLWILCLLTLILKKDNKFAVFHAKQGLVLFIASIALGLINIVPVLGQLVCFIGSLLCAVLGLIGIIKALVGEYWRMPVIADIADKFNI